LQAHAKPGIAPAPALNPPRGLPTVEGERAVPPGRNHCTYKEIHVESIERTIDVDVPVSTAYNQWTQFESFPEFMEGVEKVHQIDDTHLHWKATFPGGKAEEWDAVITEQTPDQRIAWRADDGSMNKGVVTFHHLRDDKSRVALQLSYNPEGIIENVGDKLGFMSRRVEGDLMRFKEFIENRGMETGAWRGKVEHR
jgi:uncharacterized membrane protein